MKRSLVRWIGTAACCLALAGCGPDENDPNAGRTAVPLPDPTGTSQAISEENFVYLWPFTVDRGVIECRKTRLIFIAPDGKEYALNDNAKNDGFPSIDPIQRSANGEKTSIGAVRSRAARLCTNG